MNRCIGLAPGLKQNFSQCPVTYANDDSIGAKILYADLRSTFMAHPFNAANNLHDKSNHMVRIGAVPDRKRGLDDTVSKRVVNDFTDNVFVRYGDSHGIFIEQYRVAKFDFMHDTGHPLHSDGIANYKRPG